MPRSLMAVNTFRVPATLMRSPSGRSFEPILYQPAMWNTPSTPSIGPRKESRFVMSPRRTSTPIDTRLRALRIACDRHDVMACIDQLARDATANEAGGARHEV